MTMTIPPQIEETNVVVMDDFIIDVDGRDVVITFAYGYDDGNKMVRRKTESISLGETKYNQLLNADPPAGKTFKQWIRPLIYKQIADHLGVPVGDID